MYIARAAYADGQGYGRIEGDTFYAVEATAVQDVSTAKVTAEYPLSEVQLLAPCQPSKIIALGGTYLQDPKATFDPAVHTTPFSFFKPPSAVIGPDAEIVIPVIARGALFESELAVVIGKRCSQVSAEEAMDYVLGYTICNDVSAPPVMKQDGQWARGKGMDTFCPLGPVITTELANPDDAFISADLIRAGETQELVRQSTSTQVWSVAEIISYAARYMTLEPGDVLCCGCPPGPIALEDGDTVQITIDGIGTLRNPVRFEGETREHNNI